MPIKPEELYTDKDKQQDYPQIYEGDELLAVIISFPLKEEEQETLSLEIEEPQSFNATEILTKSSVDVKLLKKKGPEEEKKALTELRKKLKESEEGANLQEEKSINPITQALLKVTTLNKVAHSLDKKAFEGKYNISGEYKADLEIVVGDSDIGSQLSLLHPSLEYLNISLPVYFEYETYKDEGPEDLDFTTKIDPYYDEVKIEDTDTNTYFTYAELKKWLKEHKDTLEKKLKDQVIYYIENNWQKIEQEYDQNLKDNEADNAYDEWKLKH